VTPAPPPMPAAVPGKVPAKRSWWEVLSGLAWIVLSFELGAFLLVYPWMDGWDTNLFATWKPGWQRWWTDPWVRGAVSGLGAVNIIISLVELFRYLRDWLFPGSRPEVG
jgi:hypothetical protein